MAESGIQPKELTTAQHRLIAALLATRTIRAACELAGVAERTAYRWLGDPRFIAALASAEAEQINSATRRLLQLTDKAIDTIEGVLDDKAAPAVLRVRAAGLALEQLVTLRNLRNGEARLSALEAALYAVPEPE